MPFTQNVQQNFEYSMNKERNMDCLLIQYAKVTKTIRQELFNIVKSNKTFVEVTWEV